jgi:hypothetical protein
MPVDPRIQALLDAPLTAASARAADRMRKGGPRGYAAPPGSGPAGKSCRQCFNRVLVWGGVRKFPKCRLVPPTHGVATDIRVSSVAYLNLTPATPARGGAATLGSQTHDHDDAGAACRPVGARDA